MTPTVTLYGRDGCHLCDDARAALHRVRARTPFTLEEVDITTDDDLHRRYLERIPVVALDGRELFDFFVDEPTLIEALSRDPPIPAARSGASRPAIASLLQRGRSPEAIGRNPR
ncbi:MAG TPA: glutaredoxin family protein, partial [Solirubrobacteraceae bacterium]|nr:glutaredoxin family protein [Solirubrobacteraceae bacterium]